MKKLFVGCRVRIVACHCTQSQASRFVGREGVIVSSGADNIDGAPYLVSCSADYGFFADELEPIQAEGAAPSEYSFTELMDRCKAGEVEA